MYVNLAGEEPHWIVGALFGIATCAPIILLIAVFVAM